MTQREPNFPKLANTVLYLLERCAPEHPGSTHLLKMLWFADYWHYCKHLRSITGGQYIAMERGPVLDGYKTLFERLEQQQIVKLETVPVFGQKDKLELRPLMEPDESGLTEAERETLDLVVAECADKSGSYLSEKTHREGPWTLVYPFTPNKPIPEPLYRWLDNLPTDADLDRAKESLARPETARDIERVLASVAA